MALTPEDLEFMRQYTSGAPPDALRQRLDSMYGPVTPEMQQAAFGGPDARTAQNMSVDPGMSTAPAPSPFVPTPENIAAAQHDAPPAPPPVATDAGGMSGGGPAMSVAPAPAASTVSPEQLRQMGAEAEARLASTGPAQPAAPTAPMQNPEDAEGQRFLIEGYRRSGGGKVIPGGEQLAGRTVSRELHGQLSPETAQELEDAGTDAQGMAVAQGESAAQQLEKQARAQGQQAQRTRSELASYKRNTAAKDAEYDIRRAEIDDMRAQIQREPITFFSGDETGHAVTKAIGLSMLGILAGPMAVMQAVNNSIAQKEKERGQAISMLDDQLNRFKEGIPDPQQRALYVRSLGMDAAAAEADRMANMAKAEDARQRGFALAEQFRMEALKARAAAETGPIGKEEIKTQNVAPKVVGGARGGMEELLRRGKLLGLTPQQTLYLANRGELPSGGGAPQTEHDLALLKDKQGRTVEVPGSNTALYAPRADDAKEIQTNLRSQKNLTDSLDRIRSMVETPGRKIDPATWNKIRAEVSQNILTVAKAGGQGAVGDAEAERLGVLGGDIAKNWTTPDSVSLETLAHIRQMMDVTKANTLGTLYSDPYSGSRYKPGAASGAGSGIQFTELK